MGKVAALVAMTALTAFAMPVDGEGCKSRKRLPCGVGIAQAEAIDAALIQTESQFTGE